MNLKNASPVVVDVLGSAHPLIVDAELPFIFADDLAAIRGDGIFETLMLRGGEVKKLELHFSRFQSGAKMLELPAPDRQTWLSATQLAVEEFTKQAGRDAEAALRWVYSRGRESTGNTTGWITVASASEKLERDRAEGVRVMTAERGFRIDLSTRSPWALVGAKTLSYAANMALLRYATDHDFDDAIYVSEEGFVLEGPTSSVVAVDGNTLITPPVEQGILPGTTQSALFKAAEAQGWQTEYRRMTVEDLFTCDGVWLVSSVRVHARVVAIDGRDLPRPSSADAVEALVWEAVG